MELLEERPHYTLPPLPSSSPPLSSSPSLIIVVGCSRGFGKSLVLESLKLIHNPIHFVLAGTNVEGMEKVGQEVKKEGVSYTTCKLDLCGSVESLTHAIEDNMLPKDPSTYSSIYMFLNSGSYVPVGHVGELDPSAIATACQLNITSFLLLTTLFLRYVHKASVSTRDRPLHVRLINVSSILAEIPLVSSGVYCAGKAARNMMMKVVAEEQKKKQGNLDFKCISWGPGPMRTDLLEATRGNDDLAFLLNGPEEFYGEPSERALMLWRLIVLDTYANGEYVDVMQIKQ